MSTNKMDSDQFFSVALTFLEGGGIIYEMYNNIYPLFMRYIYNPTLRGLNFAWINFRECRPELFLRGLIFANCQA